MKKELGTLVVASLLISSVSFATIRRVGYTGVPLAGVDYASNNFSSAHDASNPGDTIQLYGDAGSPGPTLTKRLVIIGFGYNFDANPNLQTVGTDKPSFSNYVNFAPGSENSIIEGCSGTFYVSTSNITIRRCNMFQLYFVVDLSPINNTIVVSSVVADQHMSSLNNPCTNTQFYNCILEYLSFGLLTTTGSLVNCVSSIQGGSWQFGNAAFLVKNSILTYYDAGNINTIYENNFFIAAQPSPLPLGSNNRWSQDRGVLFDRLGGTDDSPGIPSYSAFDEDYYVLKAGSPAINGGFNAANAPTDAGIYGGEPAYRYKLSGVPAVPAIYKLSAPTNAATTNPYNVTISVRSNN